MSELMNSTAACSSFRWTLLATASAISLLGYGASGARAEKDADRPTVWIELGGQLERVDDGQVPFAPPFFDAIDSAGFESPLVAGRSARYSNGIEGSITFLPEGSDWVFSGAVRYGRSNGNRFVHQQPPAIVTHFTFAGSNITKTAVPAYAQTTAKSSESHLIADFQAGRDVGLGLFGRDSTSTISLGIRFAQFTQSSNVGVLARPDVHFAPLPFYGKYIPASRWHDYFGSAQRSASFVGLGPSISWDASLPLIESGHDEAISLDWGAKGALLFGRQKADSSHRSYGSYWYFVGGQHAPHLLPTHTGASRRNHSVIVPNIGGFAALSMRYDRAKVNFGYRADYFFGAMDGGLDVRQSDTVGFHGPYATISVGLGG